MFVVIVHRNFAKIPHSTIDTYFSQPSDDPRQRWENQHNGYQQVAREIVAVNTYSSVGSGGNASDAGSSSRSSGQGLTLNNSCDIKASTIEGTGNSTGDTSIGIGGGGGGGVVSSSSSSSDLNKTANNIVVVDNISGGGLTTTLPQTPSTPTVGKTLLNTNGNLLDITTATDTFNNLKNLVKIDKTSSSSNSIGSSGSSFGIGNNNGNNNYRGTKAGNLHKGGNLSPPHHNNNLNNNGNNIINNNNNGNFSTGYNKNPVKIRQHDTEVSPRPRRTYASDSSSSRYYNKNSDNLVGQAGNSNNNNGNGNGNIEGNNRRINNGNYNNNNNNTTNHNNDGNTNGFNRNLNLTRGDDAANNSGLTGGNDRGSGGAVGGFNSGHHHQHRSQQRYISGGVGGNDFGNGQQQRHYYNNNNNNSGNSNQNNTNGINNTQIGGNTGAYNKSYRELNTRSVGGSNDYYRERDDYTNNYRNNVDHTDAPRPNRYNNNNQQNSNNNNNYNNNSLERGGPRYGGRGSGGGYNNNNNNNNNTDERPERDYRERVYQNRTPPIRATTHLNGNNNNNSNNNNYNNNNNLNKITTGGVRSNSPNIRSQTNLPQQQQQQQQPQQQQPSSKPASPPPPSAGRWVPPSLRPQHGLSQTEKNDAIFRKVRGILNKLTPEKFQELSDELLKLDLNSISVLNGVILLIFEKALDEPKYSSMYAQLCKRLSKEAPSFENDPDSLCTFLRLLIAVCRDKFNNRLKRDEFLKDEKSTTTTTTTTTSSISTTTILDGSNNVETTSTTTTTTNESDEEEKKHLAKQRMLGNVKFIGELNKLDMLSNNVLHQCILELLDKKKRRGATQQEMCEDMECVAQLLKTCGKNLDSEQGKELMNQYFEKLERRSKSNDYPPRIRFMLKDVIELRENNWVPRKVATTEGPVPIKQIRTDDDNMMIMRTPFAQRSRDMMRNNMDRDGDNWSPYHLNIQPAGYNMLSGLGVSASPMSHYNNNNNNNNRTYNNRDHRNMSNNYNNHNNNNNNNNRYNKHNNNGNNMPGGMMMQRGDDMRMRGNQADHVGMSSYAGAGGVGNNSLLMNNKELAPRFKRNLITTNENTVDNLQMRPAANSLLFKAAQTNHKLPTLLPISTPPLHDTSKTEQNNSLSNSQYPLLSTPHGNMWPTQVGGAEEKSKLQQEKFVNNNGDLQEEKKSAAQQQQQQQLVTKTGSLEKPTKAAGAAATKQEKKKDKNINKEELLQKVKQYFQEHFFYEQEQQAEEEEEEEKVEKAAENDNFDYTKHVQLKQFVDGLLEIKLPEKCLKDACINAIMDVMDKAAVNEAYIERMLHVLLGLRQAVNLKANIIVEVFKQVVKRMNDREALVPRIASYVAQMLALALESKPPLLKLNEVAAYTENGQHYPLMFLVLQQLHKIIGKDALEQKFHASKIDLMQCLPEAERNKLRFTEILDDRNLAFLYPLLKLETDMMKQLKSEPDARAFYKWINSSVDAKYYKDAGFITALVTVVLKYILHETTLAPGVDPKATPEKAVVEREFNLAQKYCSILRKFVLEHADLQLVTLYALQVVCYNENFPKGMLRRWFKYMYDEEVVEEDTFFTWKEEINDKYPGKGDALFQVNSWLTWLEEAESEDDE